MSNNLRYLHPHRPPTDGDGMVERLLQAGVTAPVILEPPTADPRQTVADAAPPLPRAPIVQRRASKAAPGDGLRLVPLAAFRWGGAVGGRAMPRVRGDHVLICVAQGTMGVEFPRMRHPVAAGRIAFVPAGTAFAMQPPEGIEGAALMVPPHLADGLTIPLPAGFCVGAPDPADQPLLQPALTALGRGSPRGPADFAATSAQLGILAVALSRLAQGAGEQHAINGRVTDARTLTEQFLSLAGANLSRNQTMSEIARDLGYSLAHLDRACQQTQGKSALDMLYQLRLERAVQLLRDTGLPVPRIAQELGYSGIGHFVRAFAAATGRSPQDFRALCTRG